MCIRSPKVKEFREKVPIMSAYTGVSDQERADGP